MYCINCGARLENSESVCPLCDTRVYHPEFETDEKNRQYPRGRVPAVKHRSKTFCGALIIMFLIPAVVSFLADIHFDREFDWSGYVIGALILGYCAFALPLWFEKPNPVIFTPCTFAATIGYLLYISCATDGSWFMSFAFPVTAGFGLIVSAVVTLLYYLKRGRLYIFGGAFALTGAFIVLVEYFISITFNISFIGWSFYPFAVLLLLGGLLLYLAINRSAREVMERKLFF